MANVLNTDKQIAIIGALAEGSSIRSIERITGVHRDTVMRLGVRAGKACTAMMDRTMRNLSCNCSDETVIDPVTAVRAAIVQEFQNAQTA